MIYGHLNEGQVHRSYIVLRARSYHPSLVPLEFEYELTGWLFPIFSSLEKVKSACFFFSELVWTLNVPMMKVHNQSSDKIICRKLISRETSAGGTNVQLRVPKWFTDVLGDVPQIC